MRMERFSGYPVTVETALTVAECRDRLLDEFTDRAGRWQHGRTERALLGWPTREGFTIGLSRRMEPLRGSGRWDTSRACVLRLRASQGGTAISGTYRYIAAERLQVGLILGAMLGGSLSLAFVVLGVVLATQQPGPGIFLWLFLAVGQFVAGVAVVLDRGDGGFPGERDRIEHALCRLLEATPVPPAPPRRGGASGRVV